MWRRSASVLAVACALVARRVSADLYDPDGYEYGYDLDSYEDLTQEYDDFGYGADDLDLDGSIHDGFQEDQGMQSYYGDEFDEYYDTYGAYGDEYGEDDDLSFAAPDRLPVDCTEDAKGKAEITGPVCDLKIKGLDEYADQLSGGLDGIYKVTGCFNGRPKYVRQKSPAGEKRALWFSTVFSDWDISRGEDVNQTAILVYAGDGLEETRPNYIASGKWHITSEFSSEAGDAAQAGLYQSLNVTVTCENDKKLDVPTAVPAQVFQPLLSNDEMEAKYRAIFTEYGKGETKPGLNYPLLVFVIVLGASVVMGVPFVLNQKVGDGSKTLGQVIHDSRKSRVGHVN